MQKLIQEIKKLKSEYDEKREKERFNIFNALHKQHDEVHLHSRFISYLLSSSSGHRMNDFFIKIFIEDVLKLTEEDFDLSNYEVLPNEHNKSEFKNIDILIINKKRKQAIIIENKIFSKKDSNNTDNKENYRGQLERYYTTIETGIDVRGNDIGDFKCNKIFIYFLSINSKRVASEESLGRLKKENIPVSHIHYETDVRRWLKLCIDKLEEEENKPLMLVEILEQYLKLLNQMTNNDIPLDERLYLKKIISEDLDTTKYLIDNFKHIKWHTIHEFWHRLKEQFTVYFKQENVKLFPNNFDEIVDDIAKSNEDINHGIIIKIQQGLEVYISGFNVLSWGTIEPKKWTNFKSSSLENISFYDFSTQNSFNLINNEEMKKAINSIVEEVIKGINNNFENLKEIE